MFGQLFAKLPTSPEEQAYRRLVEKGYKPKSIIDVGAYEGTWARLARRCFPDASILMCEAQPGKQRILEEVCLEISDATFVSALLSASSGEVREFNEMKSGSSIYPENSNISRQVRKLRTSKLDEVAVGMNWPCFLKIDVQGAELEVLEGGASTLERCDLVQLEIAVQEYNKGAPLFIDVVSYMNDRDFIPYDIAGWSRPNGLDLVQLDLLFVPRHSELRSRYFEF